MPEKNRFPAVLQPVCAEISPTVTNGPPFSRTGNERVECEALVSYGIPGNWIGRAPENGGNATTPMDNIAPCLAGADRHGVAIATQYAVRRLTPTEGERLQGFPDGYTNIPTGKKPEAPDGPRYKALGNSWAVPVVRWIGERIDRFIR